MLSTFKKTAYRGFNFVFLSEIALPELQVVNGIEEKADILIELADLKDEWNELAKSKRYYNVTGEKIWFYIPYTAIYCVCGGRKIIVSPMDGSHEEKIRLYILGSCMGALLMQRKILPLHGSAVAIDGKAYAIVGDSGAGKSTLASALLSRGYQLLSDDIIPLSILKENIPVVTPTYPQQKLWRESLNAMGNMNNEYQPIFDRQEKFAVPVSTQFSSQSIPLAGIFELIKTDTDEVKKFPISGLRSLHILFYHTYRNFLIDEAKLREWHFGVTANIANRIPVFQLCRPSSKFTAHELATLVLNNLGENEYDEKY
ncbi:aldolase [Bacillus sp. ISL-35]|uniref:hypothetical protein n=1 Tax=Bacillus sp. ISL-35 TaxID=2819122 RepID=UPI001BEC80D3|nr:hypothetical protein [Bacillus sp. ISL-35]MBT2679842.1 aldolase [Bacillus sp. ISL-35]MBT2704877.1 hypothetical protein [Chryseobacterium sp. ISL-80]